jgi:hypothetical protein
VRSCCWSATICTWPRSAPAAAWTQSPRRARAYELAEPRRFTAAWERAASLRLREADLAALHAYHRHGRLPDAGTLDEAERSAARAWLADTLTGHRSVLTVDTTSRPGSPRTSAPSWSASGAAAAT